MIDHSRQLKFYQKMWAAPDSETSFEEFKERVDKVSDVPDSNLTYDVESKTETVIDYDFEDEATENIKDSSEMNIMLQEQM